MLVMNMLALMLLAPGLASSPPSAAARAKRIDSAPTASGRAVRRWAAAAARDDGQAEHQQGASDLGGAGDGQGEDEQEYQAQAADRDAAGLGGFGSMEANSSDRYQAPITATTIKPITTRMRSWLPDACGCSLPVTTRPGHGESRHRGRPQRDSRVVRPARRPVRRVI